MGHSASTGVLVTALGEHSARLGTQSESGGCRKCALNSTYALGSLESFLEETEDGWIRCHEGE